MSKSKRVEEALLNSEWVLENKSNPIYWGFWVALKNGELLILDEKGDRLFSRASRKYKDFAIVFINEGGVQTVEYNTKAS